MQFLILTITILLVVPLVHELALLQLALTHSLIQNDLLALSVSPMSTPQLTLCALHTEICRSRLSDEPLQTLMNIITFKQSASFCFIASKECL